MKLILLTAVVACFVFVPERAYGALPTCPADLQCPENSACTASGTPCTCNDGYHLNSAGDGCALDVAAEGTCTETNMPRECVDHATCKDVSETAGGTPVLKCMCDVGHHQEDDGNGKQICVEDVAAEGNCTETNMPRECVDHATCKDVSEPAGTPVLKCMCDVGHHQEDDGNGKQICVEDVAAEGACTETNMTRECVDHATCKNVSESEGVTPVPKCMCDVGHHQEDDGNGKKICVEDVAAEGNCTDPNMPRECVDHATCKNVSEPAGGTPVLKCMCDLGHHQEDDENGKKICVEDTCQYTVTTCKVAGMANCAAVETYIGCLLNGACKAEVEDQVMMFGQALMDARTDVSGNCNATEGTNCAENVTGCFVPYLKADVSCSLVKDLDTCLQSQKNSCMADAKVFDLADNYKTLTYGNLSCECVMGVDECVAVPEASLNGTSDATAKCDAVKELFTCAMLDKCNASKTVDMRAISSAWTMANTRASENSCKDTITTEAATSCALQLTRCALIYGQDKSNVTGHQLQECSAAERFGSCLMSDTTLCSTEGALARKKLFTDQYDLVSASCVCANDINKCNAERGEMTNDPAVNCPKLETFSLCVTRVKCDISQPDNEIHKAYDYYTETKNTYNCNITTNNTCQSGVASCSDKFMIAVSPAGVPSTQMCQAYLDSLLCVNGANCNHTDDELLGTFRNASAVRVAALSCGELKCTGTHVDILACKATYDDNFSLAGADNGKKCTAKNNMVKCLRGAHCNPNLKTLVDTKYEALTKVQVAGCDMLPLVEPDSGSGTLHITLLPVLASVVLGWMLLAL